MLKILAAQARDKLSAGRAGFLINDRLSFVRFLGPGDGVPGAKTTRAGSADRPRAGLP